MIRVRSRVLLSALVSCVVVVAHARASDESVSEWEGEDYQGSSVSVAEGYGFRVDVGGSQTRCLFPAPSTQFCVIPPDKTIRTRVTRQGISEAERAEIEGIIFPAHAQWQTQSFWSFALQASGDGDVNIQYGTLSGGAVTSIHRFARVTVPNGVELTESLSGQWYKYTGPMTCTIDKAAIDANFNTAARRNRVRAHAVYYCILKAAGVGSGGHFSRPHSIAVTPDLDKSLLLSSKVRCQLQKLSNISDGSLITHSECNSESDD